MVSFLKLDVGNGVSIEAEPSNKDYFKYWEDDDCLEKGLPHDLYLTVFRISPNSKIHIGGTNFSPMPGCPAVVVSYGTYLTPETRGSGLSNPFRQLKEQIARGLGYNRMIATCDMDNLPAVGNMMKSSYKIQDTFLSNRTGHLVGFGIKKLK